MPQDSISNEHLVSKAATVSVQSIYKHNNQNDQQHKSLTTVGRARIVQNTMDDIKDDTMVHIKDDTKDGIKDDSFTQSTIQSYVKPENVISFIVNRSAQTRYMIVKEHEKCYI